MSIPAALQRRRDYDRLALFSYGFRPFFLAAGLWATLGHTGQVLWAGRATQAIYALLLVAALVRIVAAFMGSVSLLEFAGLAWTAAFILFVMLYGPLLVMRRPGWSEARC